jgi:hypothetical protein
LVSANSHGSLDGGQHRSVGIRGTAWYFPVVTEFLCRGFNARTSSQTNPREALARSSPVGEMNHDVVAADVRQYKAEAIT